ncbi:MAG TPA: helix-turn-helix domain-containing protein [Phycisphaerae bacterium]|nr:helix-turn-helix domain-containing protein [Phycisphaerae bacterium]
MTDQTTQTPRLLLSAREGARALSVSERTLWERTKTGEIPCVRIGRRVLYDVRDLVAYIDRQKGAQHGTS